MAMNHGIELQVKRELQSKSASPQKEKGKKRKNPKLPSLKISTKIRLELAASLPPFKMTELPDLSARAEIWMFTYEPRGH